MINSSPVGQRRSFSVFVTLVLVTAILYWAQKILIPVALAILLAFILTPPVSALQRRGLGRVPSVLVVTFLVFLILSALGWIISQQVGGLIGRLPNYQGEIVRKIESLRGSGEGGPFATFRHFLTSVTDQLVDEPQPRPGEPGPVAPGGAPEKPAYVTMATSGWSRLVELAGPAGEMLAETFLVIILVIFMLVQRENLRNRVVRLIGHGHLALTTRAIDEGARRISRYLLMQVFINATFAMLLSVGLFLLGLYVDEPGRPALRTTAVLWGFLAGALRFVPYLGTWLAGALLVAFSVATLPGWTYPLIVLAYFIVLELVTANVVEPLLFGHSTGSSPLALLLAAAFWTWLWGPVGLILSTPLTVMMVVLGKYVPELQFFEVLLGDEPPLSAGMMFYQRLVARDQDEASDLADDYVRERGLEAFCEDLLLPAVTRARRDLERGDIDARTLDYVYQATREALNEAASPPAEDGTPRAAVVLACPARDEGEELALRMFATIMQASGYRVDVVSSKALAGEMLEQVHESRPSVICVGALPPGGLAQARYLCKRLRGQCPKGKMVVCRFGHEDDEDTMVQRLKAAGADFVATTLADARAQVLPLVQVAAIAATAAEAKSRTTAPATAGAGR